MPLTYQILPVTAFAQNCSILMCQKTGDIAVVDPGGDLEKIESVISTMGGHLRKILLTHAHIDHAGATADFADQYDIPIEGPHPDEIFWIDMLPQQAQMFGFPPARTFTPSRWLQNGDSVTVGEVSLDVYHCPGHTPGHVIFHSVEDQLAIVGDVLFAGSIGRTDFPKGNHAQLVNSIRSRLWPLGDEVMFIPGHGETSTFGRERQTNPFVGDNV